uniref:Peroxisomal sarcosine oxidase-like n=1 Tax=Saccoglossus kowalevskii TaxID=10224 RepID=A0ABM0LZC0_SACKO|nr:PREDICTED: peroxisomal sarcosine oxidase-like [Saccoglossus kowalevskii]
MNQDYIWDAVVVGAGVEGSSTAYNLSKNNQKTLLLEQFGLPHSRGSSHGQTRIIRYGYSEPYYSAMMPECFRIWHDVEKQTGVTLITETKLLTLDIPPYTGLKNKKEVLTNLGIGLESFNGRQLKEKYPMIECGPQYKAILENGAGVIRADKSLKALQELFVRNGGVIHDEEKYIDVFPGDVLTIRTNKGSYKAKCLILTVGPWAGKLLNPLGVHVPLKASSYFSISVILLSYGATLLPYGTTLLPYGATLLLYGATLLLYGATLLPYGATLLHYGATLLLYGATLLPYGATLLLYGATLQPYGATLLLYGATLQPYGATLLPYGATLLLHGATLQSHGATLLPYGTTLLLYGATLLLYGPTLLPCGATLLPYGATLLPYVATLLPYGATLLLYGATLLQCATLLTTGCYTATLWCYIATIGSYIATLWCYIATLWCYIATLWVLHCYSVLHCLPQGATQLPYGATLLPYRELHCYVMVLHCYLMVLHCYLMVLHCYLMVLHCYLMVLHCYLKAQRINACYWREKSPGNCAGFPNFIDNSHRTYGIQITEYPNTMKVIKTKLCYWKEKSSGSFSNFPCFVDYTGSLVYGACPLEYPNAMKFPNVIIFFTGHGFKLAPVVGKVLSELAMKKTPSYDLSHFTIERFFKSQKSKL